MIWLALAGLATVALAPLAWALRTPARARGRAAADAALYRAQLAELDREREVGRLDAVSHAAATLEVQRRLLAAPAEPRVADGGRAGVLAALAVVPALAVGLYLAEGSPGLPTASLATREEKAGEDAALLASLRQRLERLDPASEAAVRGWVLLGNAERSRGRLPDAIAAYRTALAARFEPDTAALLAQVQLEADDAVGAEATLAAALPSAPDHVGLRFLGGLVAERAGRAAAAREAWGALLRDAPADAAWRVMVERRMEALPGP